MKLSGGAGFALGCVFSMTLAGGSIAVAATGGDLVLGKSNSATKTTSLTDKKGTALSLVSKGSSAPLKVNSHAKVAHLNSDLLDGIDSGAFARTAGQTGIVQATGQAVDINSDGTPDGIVADVACPDGTKLTGGGGDNFLNEITYANFPGGANDWAQISTWTSGDDATQMDAYAICYNPKGAVPGATPAIHRTTGGGSPAVRAALGRLAARTGTAR